MTGAGSYPRTIEDGGGLRLTFLARTRDVLEVRNAVAPGAGPPMHVHHRQEESLTVERGTLGYQRLGEAEEHAGPGQTVTFPPGVAHRFWNAGEDELVCSGAARPPHNLEYFLTELYASTRRHDGKRPGLLDAAWLSHRYRDSSRPWRSRRRSAASYFRSSPVWATHSACGVATRARRSQSGPSRPLAAGRYVRFQPK